MRKRSVSEQAQSPNLKNQSARGIVWTMLAKLANALISFVIFASLARLVEPDAFGLIAMAFVFTQVVGLIVNQGLGQAIVQRKEIDPLHLDAAFCWSLCFGTLAFALMWIGAGPIAQLYETPELAWVLRIMSISFFLGGLSGVPLGILERGMKYKTIAAQSTTAALCSGVGALVVAWLGGGVWALVCQTVSLALIRTVLVWWAVDWMPRLKWSWQHFKELFAFSSGMLTVRTLETISIRSADFLMGIYLGVVSLGLYSVASRLLVMSNELISNSVGRITFVSFSKVQSDPQRIARGYFFVLRMTSLYAIPFYLTFMIFGQEIILIVFGQKYMESGTVIQILSVAGLMSSINGFYRPLLMGVGKIWLAVALILMATVLNIIGFAIAAPHGIEWVAGALAIRAVATYPIVMLTLRKSLGISIRKTFRAIRVPVLSGIVMAGMMLLFDHFLDVNQQYVVFPLATLLGCLAYLTMCRLLDASLVRDFMGLIKGLKSKKKLAT